MFRSLCLKALPLFVATFVTIFLILQLTLGSAFAQENQPNRQPDPQPAPSIQVKTDKAEKDKQVQPTKNRDRPADPYAKYYKGIKKFNEEVYGKKG